MTARPPLNTAAALLDSSSLAEVIRNVEGFLYLGEAWKLHESARQVETTVQNPIVVEIGSWKGRSTIALALGLKTRGAGTVYAIDPHTGSPDLVRQFGPVDTFDAFLENIRQAGVSEFVVPVRATAHDARERFVENSAHLLFVDGSHEYADVRQDIDDWSAVVVAGGVVAFNDPSAPGVYRALRECVLLWRSPFRRPTLVQNTLFFIMRRGDSWTTKDALAFLRLKAVLYLRCKTMYVRPFLPSWLIRQGHAISARLVGGMRD